MLVEAAEAVLAGNWRAGCTLYVAAMKVASLHDAKGYDDAAGGWPLFYDWRCWLEATHARAEGTP